MSVMRQVRDDEPLMIAWKAYLKTEDYQNTFKWLAFEEHRVGSMWALFMAGFQAALQSPRASDEGLGEASGAVSIPIETIRDWYTQVFVMFVEATPQGDDDEDDRPTPKCMVEMEAALKGGPTLSANPVPVDASGVEPVAPKVFRATTPIDLMQKVFKHHGWPITLGRMAAKFSTLYELSADARNNRYVATPRHSHTAPVADAQAKEGAIEEAIKREREGCARKAQRYIRGTGSMTREEAARGVAHEIRTRTTKDDPRHD